MGKAAQARVAELRGQTAVAGKRLATDELNFGDLDGDAKADLAAIDSTGRLWVYPGKATVYSGTGPRPTSHFAARFQAGSGWSRFTALVRHGDWNNDGKQDVLARDPQGRLFLYAGTGTRPAVVRNGVQVGTGWNTFGDIVGVGDVGRRRIRRPGGSPERHASPCTSGPVTDPRRSAGQTAIVRQWLERRPADHDRRLERRRSQRISCSAILRDEIYLYWSRLRRPPLQRTGADLRI